MPYYYDERVTDDSPSDVERREAVLGGIERGEKFYRFLKPRFDKISVKANKSSRLYAAVSDHLENFEKRNAPRRKHAETTEEYEGKATVAQEFDSRVSTKFYSMLRMGMALRVADQALATGPDRKLETAREEIHGRLLETNDAVMKEAEIEVIPIQKLVRIQLGSGLMIAEHLKSR